MPRPIIVGPDGLPFKKEDRQRQLAEQGGPITKAQADAFINVLSAAAAACDCQLGPTMAAGGTGWECPGEGCAHPHTHVLLRVLGSDDIGVCSTCWNGRKRAVDKPVTQR